MHFRWETRDEAQELFCRNGGVRVSWGAQQYPGQLWVSRKLLSSRNHHVIFVIDWERRYACAKMWLLDLILSGFYHVTYMYFFLQSPNMLVVNFKLGRSSSDDFCNYFCFLILFLMEICACVLIIVKVFIKVRISLCFFKWKKNIVHVVYVNM